MESDQIHGDLVVELYGVNDACFFATCWEGNDELEQALFDWASDDNSAAVDDAAESPIQLEALIREAGDEVLADFINYLDRDLRRDALTAIIDFFKADGEKQFTSDIEDQLRAILAAI